MGERVQAQDSLQERVGQTKGWSAGGQFLILARVSAWVLLGLNEEEISKLLKRSEGSGSRVLIVSRFAAREIPFLPPSSSHSLFTDQGRLRVFCSPFDFEPSRPQPQRSFRCFTDCTGESPVLRDVSAVGDAGVRVPGT